MRIAFITDIHANLEALKAVLADIDLIGVDRLVCLGDIVGYGADPQACVDIIAERVAHGAIAVKGNHDAAMSLGVAGMSRAAANALVWTTAQVDAVGCRFLADLPMVHAEADRLYVHASPNDPLAWGYVFDTADALDAFAATDARLIFCGHTHMPALFHAPTGVLGAGDALSFWPEGAVEVTLAPTRRYLAVIGSVGQPRDGDPSACWGLYDEEKQTLAWRRLPYDVATAQAKIRAAGLPERLWMRLAAGR